MSLWRHLTRGLYRLTRADAAERELADEVEHFFDEAARSFDAQGLSPDEARRAMALQLGTTDSVRESVRSHGWEHTVETVFADLRYGARRLLGNPGFTTVTVLTLALGIGASVAMFSAAKPTLIDALPYPEPDRIVTVWDHASDGALLEVTFGTYRELDERSRSLERAAVFGSWSPSLTGRGEAERLDGQRVSADYFDVLGVRPAVGRDFEPTDDRPGGVKVAILSDALWHRRFGGDPSIVGSQIQLDDEPYMVIGVMPRGFENVLAPSTDAWRPLQYDASLPSFERREWGHHLRLVARLRAGIDLDAARRELEDIAGGPIAEFSRPPWATVGQGFVVSSLDEEVTRSVKPALLAVLGAVGILLIVASVNVTNLLLGRSRQRRSELAMRLALGASRLRLVRQLLTETVLLALPGGGLGVVVAAAATPVLIALVPAEMPRHDGIGVDGAVLTFALGLTFTVAVGAGLLPALEATRGAHDGLQRLRPATGRPTTRRILVVAEVALAAVLLVSAGLLLRSLNNLFAVSLGFDSAQVLTMQVQTSGRRLDRDATHRFFAQALDAVRQVPGVTAAAFTSQLPFGGEISEYGVALESSSDKAQGGNPAFRYAVSPGYLEALRIPLIHGRLLDRRDTANAPPVVVISESLAKKIPANDPLGYRLHVGPVDRGPYTIVGVVGDVKQASLSTDRSDAVYITNEQWAFIEQALWLVARANSDPTLLAASIKSAISSIDRNHPIARVATMNTLIAASTADRRFAFALLQAFSLAALILAALGLYGVLAGGVNERMREIGVRSALGASRGDILALVLGQGLTLSAIGVVIGLGIAVGTGRALESLLFGVSRVDPTTYFAVAALVIAVSLFASGVPARRAASIDAAETLRTE